MMGGHSSHSYINGTNMYFNYFFNVVGLSGPRRRPTKYYLPIIGIICEETLKRGGSIVHHHGIGKAGRRGSRRSTGRRSTSSRASSGLRPARHHEQGDDTAAPARRRVDRRGYLSGRWTRGRRSVTIEA
jgi:hypothetical protein